MRHWQLQVCKLRDDVNPVLTRLRTGLILEDASQLILAGVLAEVPNEQRVAGRIILCIRNRNIASWLHRHLQKGTFSSCSSLDGRGLPCKPSLAFDCFP